MVGGQHSRDVKLKVVETHPDLIEVKVGETEETLEANVTKTPIQISIPKGSRPANFLGLEEDRLGKIMIETTHPEAPLIKILVRFAVQD
jgi:hypothetical protein